MELAAKQLGKIRLNQLSDERLISLYLCAYNQKMDIDFLRMLLNETVQRNICYLLFETSEDSRLEVLNR
jgi:hypothetical protein